MEAITVAAVSTKNWVDQKERSEENIRRWARKAKGKGAEFILFPELGVSGYLHSSRAWDIAEPVPGPSVSRLVEIAGELDTTLCFGILERDADIVYNTQVVVDGHGIIGKQRKIHMPGVEYMYWRGGFEIDSINIGKARIGITICYDSLFSEMARTLFFKGAEILVMPFAYETMPRERFPEEDLTALTYRVHCYINGCFGIVANNAGTRRKTKDEKGFKFPGWAGIFGPDGEVIEFTRDKGNGEAMVVSELDPERLAKRRRNPYFVPRCLRPELYETIDHGRLGGR